MISVLCATTRPFIENGWNLRGSPRALWLFVDCGCVIKFPCLPRQALPCQSSSITSRTEFSQRSAQLGQQLLSWRALPCSAVSLRKDDDLLSPAQQSKGPRAIQGWSQFCPVSPVVVIYQQIPRLAVWGRVFDVSSGKAFCTRHDTGDLRQWQPHRLVPIRSSTVKVRDIDSLQDACFVRRRKVSN